MITCTCPNCGKTLEIKDPSRDFMFCEYCGTKIGLNINVNVNYSYSEHKETSSHTEHIVDDAKIKNAENINRVIGIFATPFEAFHAKQEKKRKDEERAEEELREFQRKAQERTEAARQKAAEESAEFRAKASDVWANLCKSAGKDFSFLAMKCRQYPKRAACVAAVCIILFYGIGASNSVHERKQAEAASHAALLNQLKEEEIAASHQAQGEAFFPEELAVTGDYRIPYKALRDAGFTNITLDPKGDLILGYFETENDITEITVDGSPEFKKGVWIQADTPIIISYHSFAGKDAASSKIQETVDTATSKVEQAASSLSSAVESAINSSVSYPMIDKNILRSYSYDHVYFRKGDSDSNHYWLLDNTNHFACMINTYEQSAYFFSLPSDDYSNGFKISLGLMAGYTLRSNALDTGLLVQYDSVGPFYFQIASKDEALNTLMSMQNFYDLRSVSNLVAVPSTGIRSTKSSADSPEANLVSSDATSAKPEPSLDYTPSHKDTNYDNNAYVLSDAEGDGKVYVLVSYTDKIVRIFVYGNGYSKDGYVGHITTGNKSDGFFVHFNYTEGYDWFIKPSGNQMVLVDQYLKNYIYTTVPSHPVRDIYTNQKYKDIPET